MPLKFSCDIAIIGGGAAGLIAGIAAARTMKSYGRIVILEHQQRVGKKLLSTGNGKCNLTNIYAAVENYHGASNDFIDSVLSHFPPDETIRFFSSLGLLCRAEADGRVYPYSGQASAVLDLLRNELALSNVEEVCDCHIENITQQHGSFMVLTNQGSIKCRKLIMATGGNALPSSGSDGSGYALMQTLHHTATPRFPALVQIKMQETFVRALKGIRCDGQVSLAADGKTVKAETGEIQFTETGLSGICVFQLSRLAGEYFEHKSIHGKPCKSIELHLNLMPNYDNKKVTELLSDRVKMLSDTTLENFLVGILNKRIGQALLKSAEIAPLSRLSKDLTPLELSVISETIQCWSFHPIGTMGWNNAQVTAGGLKTDQFSAHTLESAKVPGLYAAGELLDVDGDCGGYNLQWAWSSGHLAGTSAAQAILDEIQ